MALKIAKNLTDSLRGAQPSREVAARTYLVKETDPLVKTVLDGRYRVLSRIGEGSMSTVYKGQHELTGRIVAIKVLRREFSMDEDSTRRFRREVKAISTLSHPYLIAVHDVGTTMAGQPYQVIEYLQGQSLADVIQQRGALDPQRSARIVSHICDAMEHAHSKGVIHRDLKPENVMLTNFGGKPDYVKVVDFGIVKLTKESQLVSQRLTTTGEVWGSPQYASPEQCMGQDLDRRSDIYSLGLVLYEALTGKPAVSGKGIGQIAVKHVRERPASFDAACPGHRIPPQLEAATFKAIEKDPARRFQTMAEMRDALELLFPGIGAAAEPPAVDHQVSSEQPGQQTAGMASGRQTIPSSAQLARVAGSAAVGKGQATVAGDALSASSNIQEPATDQSQQIGRQPATKQSGNVLKSGGGAPSLQTILIVAAVVSALALIAVLLMVMGRQ